MNNNTNNVDIISNDQVCQVDSYCVISSNLNKFLGGKDQWIEFWDYIQIEDTIKFYQKTDTGYAEPLKLSSVLDESLDVQIVRSLPQLGVKFSLIWKNEFGLLWSPFGYVYTNTEPCWRLHQTPEGICFRWIDWNSHTNEHHYLSVEKESNRDTTIELKALYPNERPLPSMYWRIFPVACPFNFPLNWPFTISTCISNIPNTLVNSSNTDQNSIENKHTTSTNDWVVIDTISTHAQDSGETLQLNSESPICRICWKLPNLNATSGALQWTVACKSHNSPTSISFLPLAFLAAASETDVTNDDVATRQIYGKLYVQTGSSEWTKLGVNDTNKICGVSRSDSISQSNCLFCIYQLARNVEIAQRIENIPLPSTS